MGKITYGFYQFSVGEIIIGMSDKGLCWLGFMVKGYKGDGLERMKKFFPDADFVQDNAGVEKTGDDIVAAWEKGELPKTPLDIRGTDFQKSVWMNLLAIPKGEVCNYGDIANDIGRPKASRAVGSAVGSNPVSLIVPCHRVVPMGGGLGNYGWGVDIKEALLDMERAS